MATVVCKSKIIGDFRGWEGNTAYKLSNGQIWKQSEYKYEYKYAYQPDVVIYRVDNSHYMSVEGTQANVTKIQG